MLKTCIKVVAIAGALCFASSAFGQALPTATGGHSLQIGAGATLGKPDYGNDFIGGISAFADYDLWSHVGLEADAHILTLRTPQDLGEDTYEAGPRFYWRAKRLNFYGKALLGYGNFIVLETQDNPGKSNAGSFMYSLGGGVDLDLPHHLTIRAFDFEYQKWPNFANHGLTPAMGTVGAAYRF